FVTGDERDRRRVVAMRDRNPGVRGTRDRRRDARHDLEVDAGRDELLGLLAAASETERIAALEPHDALSLARFVDEELIDLILRQRVRARSFADGNTLARDERRDLRRDERIDGD